MIQSNKYYVIIGEASTRKVFINGIELDPTRSQKTINHSPDGFNWGYGGSGPAQLALAICLHITNEMKGYQSLKWLLVSKLPKDEDFTIHLTGSEIIDMINANPFLKKA